MTIIHRISMVLLLVNFLSIPTIAQVYEHFNQDINQLKNAWKFSDSSFWVNPKNQLQAKVTTKKYTAIYASLPVKKIDSIIEWNAFISFDFNPSTQNFVRFYLYADTINLNSSNNSLYVQFGGINGTDDLIELVKQQDNSKQILASSSPGFLKQNAAAFNFKCLIDTAGFLHLQIDTSLNDSFIELAKISSPILPLQFYTGFWFKFTSSYANSLVLDDFYFGKAHQPKLPLQLTSFIASSDSSLQFTFNQAIDTSQLQSYFQSSIQEEFRCFYNTSFDTISMVFNTNLKLYQTYEICLSGIHTPEGFTCADTCFSQVNYQIKIGDIRISELMVDSDPVIALPDAEYIEIYNNSSFVLNLDSLFISDKQTSARLPSYFLKPNEFVLICACKDSSLFTSISKICVGSLPSLNNSADTILVLNRNQYPIDQVAYQTSWYHTNPIPSGGRSLCLTNVNSDCPAIENWYASADSSGGSPGKSGLLWNTNQDSVQLKLLSFSAISDQAFQAVFNKKLSTIHLQVNGIDIPTDGPVNALDTFIFKMPIMYLNQKFTIHFYATCACNQNCIDTLFEYNYIPLIQAKYNQLLFSEICFDPKPGSQVPAFIELYNASNGRINLKDYKICNGNTCVQLPAYELFPDAYLAISKTGIAETANQFILPNLFPFYLTDTLCIRNKDNFLVNYLPYSQKFYHDLYKQTTKGWSIEQVNLHLPCMTEFNWQACLAIKQHTAGLPNSIQTKTIDTIPAKLMKLYLPNEQQIQLDFNEAIDSTAIATNYQLTLSGHQLQWHYTNSNQSLLLQISPQLKNNESYVLQIQQIKDCAGNSMPIQHRNFSLPAAIDSGNLLINEILFDPVSTGDDFIELYNNSPHYLDLKSLYFSFSTNESAPVTAVCIFAPTGYLLPPFDYVIVTPSDQNMIYQQTNTNKQIFVNLPNLSNEGGYLSLHTGNQKQLDAVSYSPQMHFKLLPSFEGVSLERIASNLPGTFSDNWHSASAQFNYATPTQVNSMQLKIANTSNSLLVEPSVFSPDEDAFEDVLKIQYQFSNASNFSALNIYDLQGMLIKNLAVQYWGADHGLWIWDGLNMEGMPVPEGFYVVKLDVFTPEGRVESIRKTVVLTRRERN